jgi:hypothetical protein
MASSINRTRPDQHQPNLDKTIGSSHTLVSRCGSALARRVTPRVGRNARPVSSGPSGPTRGQAGAPAGRRDALRAIPADRRRRPRTNELDAGRPRAGWYSRRARASAERGRVQGPGRAEADFGPRTLSDTLFASTIQSRSPDRSIAISRPPRRPPGWVPIGSPDPSPDGSPNPSPDGSPWGWGTYRSRPRPVCPGQTLRGAGSRAKTARDPAPLRYVGVRPIDSSPVDGPPSSAHDGRNRGGRTIGPALRAGRASRAIRENQFAGFAAIPHFK